MRERERGVMGGAMMKGIYGNSSLQQQQHYSSTNSSNRKRWNVYLVTLIILLFFGSAVLGLMAIHRLRDRRIFNLLIRDKDDQIDSLQIRLQREGEHVQDGRMKIEELRMKIYSLRAQKKELHGKIQQLHSTISSLTQEAKTLESTIEEQQNETRILKEQCSQVKDQNSQFQSLTELLRHKDAEIEDLRHRLQSPASTGHTTDLPGKMTGEGSFKNDTSIFIEKESSEQAGEVKESENRSSADNAGGRVESERLINVGRRSRIMERNDKYDSESTKSNSETESNDNAGNKEQKPKDEDGEAHARDGEGQGTGGNSESISISDSRGGDDEETNKGGVKLEFENHGNKSRLKGYLKRLKGSRWRAIRGETERTRNSASNDLAKDTMEEKQFMKDDKARDEQVNTEANLRAHADENMEDSPPGNNSQNSINPIDPQNTIQNEAKHVALDTSNEIKNQQFTNTGSVSSHGSLNGGREQHRQEAAHNNEQDSIIRQHTGNTDILETSQQTKAEINVNQENDNKLENSGETETETSISKESAASVAESKQEHGTRAKEPEF